jgi:spore maturation protein CgeB
LLKEAREFRPDLILVLKGEWLQAEVLSRLKASTKATLAVWWVDHPFINAESLSPWPYVSACIPLYDHCFLFDRSYEPELWAAGARAVHFLPCAADTDLFRSQVLTNGERIRYGASVSLIGVRTASRAQTLKALCAVPGLGVWGPGWQGWLEEQNNLQAYRGEILEPVEACMVYNASPVNLNTHHHQSRDGGLNTRAFEIPAASAFELTDWVPGLEALLEPGREVAVYRNPEDAADLAAYYIKAEEERRRIAEAGHRRVLAHHTYRHRMQTLLEAVL